MSGFKLVTQCIHTNVYLIQTPLHPKQLFSADQHKERTFFILLFLIFQEQFSCSSTDKRSKSRVERNKNKSNKIVVLKVENHVEEKRNVKGFITINQ